MTIPQNHYILFRVLDSLFVQFRDLIEQNDDEDRYEILKDHIRDMYYLLSDVLVEFEVKNEDELMELSSVQCLMDRLNRYEDKR